MKKTNVYQLMMLCALLMFGVKGIRAQVGINTDMPKATMDIKGKPMDSNEMDGLLVPRLTGDELQSKTYGLAQNGALIFATERANSPSGQVLDVTGKGLYYFSAQKNEV